ncbi:alpha/beta hydrolase [Mycoplasmopsis ciconiae]|uniref:Alpha/beta hydrolase n=1 Tax=Mycoplasmopsis ciconiae TaxID=561067 RepID=A0ABU7MLW7_9BACT|nr:alpha/beta hydrolase [Mycoplasmopsis ciconiae]
MRDYKIYKYDDLNIGYFEQNNSKDKTLLFVHGFSSDYNYFDKVFEYFANDYNFVGINMPIHGNSQFHKNKINLLYFKQVLENFIKNQKYDNLTIIGHSMGGGLAMMVADQLNSYIEKIVLVGPMTKAGLSKVEEFEECFFPRNFEEYKKLVHLCYYNPQKFLETPHLKEKMDNYFNNNQEKLNYIYQLGHSLPNLENMNAIELGMKNFKKPVAVFYGESDGIVPVEEFPNYYKDYSNFKLYKIEKSGHSIWLENYNDFVFRLEEFLKI